MKTICKHIIMLAALSFSGGWLFSQPAPENLILKSSIYKSGIFMNDTDYLNGKMKYEINCKSPGHNKIRVNNLFSQSIIKVTYGGRRYLLKKSDVYAYRDSKGITYRFYGDDEYTIAEPGGIYIYIQQQPVPEPKGFKVVNKYFFSKTPNGNIQELTLNNLIIAYLNDDAFRNMIVANFADGQNVCAYDNQNKMFKLNYLYAKARGDINP